MSRVFPLQASLSKGTRMRTGKERSYRRAVRRSVIAPRSPTSVVPIISACALRHKSCNFHSRGPTLTLKQEYPSCGNHVEIHRVLMLPLMLSNPLRTKEKEQHGRLRFIRRPGKTKFGRLRWKQKVCNQSYQNPCIPNEFREANAFNTQ